MRSLTILAVPIYQKLGKKYPKLDERREATKQYILNEITHWKIKRAVTPNIYAFKPVEFEKTENSAAFEVRLVYDEDTDLWELKFGDLNAKTDQEKFKWDDNDPNKLQKALFLHNVIDKDIIPMLKSGEIPGVQFSPYDGDDLGDDRLSYFYNMFTKLGKQDFSWTHDKDDDKYYITPKD